MRFCRSNNDAAWRSNIGLRVKLSLGLKLCKLQGRFLARVNYTVNYKISVRARDFRWVTCLFSRGLNTATLRALQLSTPTRSTQKHRQNSCYPPCPFAALSRTSDFITREMRPSARISSNSSKYKLESTSPS